MKSVKSKFSILAAAVLVIAIGVVPTAFASTQSTYQATASLASVSSAATPALTTVDVKIHFSPSSVTVVQGNPAVGHATVHNGLTSVFTATGCTLLVKAPGSSKYVNLGCSLTAPIPIAAGGSTKLTLTIQTSTSTATGVYSLKLLLTTASDKSHPGLLSMDVVAPSA